MRDAQPAGGEAWRFFLSLASSDKICEGTSICFTNSLFVAIRQPQAVVINPALPELGRTSPAHLASAPPSVPSGEKSEGCLELLPKTSILSIVCLITLNLLLPMMGL